MSDTPQSPPPSEPGPTGSGQSSTSFNADQMKATLQSTHQYDLGIMGLGILAFIASLLPFYSYSAGPFSTSLTAWHGFFGWFGVLLLMVAAGLVAASVFGNVVIPSLRLGVLGVTAASLVCLLLALLVMPGGGYDAAGYSSGHSFGYYLALLCSLGATGLAFLRKDATA